MRKEITVQLEDRGKQLTFKIKEMPATKMERWIIRALLLLLRGENAASLDSAQSAVSSSDLNKAANFLMKDGVKALARVDYEEAEPLLEELLNCCRRVDAGVDQLCTSDTVDGYIEDVRTLFKLRMEAAKLNLSFFTEKASTSPAEQPTIKIQRK
jgi:hypothetical protein